MNNINEYLKQIDILNVSGRWIHDRMKKLTQDVRQNSLTPEKKRQLNELRGRVQSWVREFKQLGIEDILNEN